MCHTFKNARAACGLSAIADYLVFCNFAKQVALLSQTGRAMLRVCL